jgi:DNA transposition AAA+ family ATPase
MTAQTEEEAFIAEQFAWLLGFREQTGLSWADLSKRTNIAEGTISQIGSAKGYTGKRMPLADKIHQYRRSLAARDTTYIDAPDIPGYFETQTATEVLALLLWAQRGKMVGIPIGSGLGKTTAANHFAALYPHIYIAMMPPSCGSQGPMQVAVLEALGVENASGTPHGLSSMIVDRLRKMHRPVLIIDEAQHLTVKALEEIRSWHDKIGVGIALMGDIRLAHMINNGTGKNDLPQFRRRIKMMPARTLPYAQDVEALAAAWNVHDKRAVQEIRRIAQRPGGLGLATQALETAAILAASEQAVLGLSHIQEAGADLHRRERVA